MLREADSRKQRSEKAFVLFLSSMMNLFDQLLVALPEASKLSIVMRNMLPYLGQAITVKFAINSVKPKYETHGLKGLTGAEEN